LPQNLLAIPDGPELIVIARPARAVAIQLDCFVACGSSQ